MHNTSIEVFYARVLGHRGDGKVTGCYDDVVEYLVLGSKRDDNNLYEKTV